VTRALALAFALASVAPPARAALWEAERDWSEAEEGRFAAWIEANVDEGFFLHPPIAHDCADLPYALRWVYARERRLPVAATAIDGRRFGHWSPQFQPVSRGSWRRDAHFLAALEFLFANTGTKTLGEDTYPVALDRAHLQAGVVYHAEHHAAVVSRVVLDGTEPHPLVTWESTLPPAVRRLRVGVFSGSAPVDHSHGLRRFRWPVRKDGGWDYVDVEFQSGWSEEQYDLAFVAGKVSFALAVAERLAPEPAPPDRQFLKYAEQAERLARERVPIVLAGHRACSKAPARCKEGSGLWELYSTPNRDARMLGFLARVRELVEGGRVDRTWAFDVMRSKGIEIGATLDGARDAAVGVRGGPDRGQRIDLLELYEHADLVSSEPADPIEQRWGRAACATLAERAAAVEESIAFLRSNQSEAPDDYAVRAVELRQRELDAIDGDRRAKGCLPADGEEFDSEAAPVAAPAAAPSVSAPPPLANEAAR
jgi:hypothetical protein